MKQIEDNMLDITDGIICHQVNCQGVMGAGIALQIKKRFPEVFKQYRKNYNNGNLTLGTNLYVFIDNALVVANLAGQNRYGSNNMHTDYTSLQQCLDDLKLFRNMYMAGQPIYFPYKMSCGMGGGDWNIVSNMIELVFPDAIVVKPNF